MSATSMICVHNFLCGEVSVKVSVVEFELIQASCPGQLSLYSVQPSVGGQSEMITGNGYGHR